MTSRDVLQAITAMKEDVNKLSDVSSPQLSHYREAPDEDYTRIAQGAELISSTATKYSLLGKVSVVEHEKCAKEFLQGCDTLRHACVRICSDQAGFGSAARKHAKRAVLAILQAVIQLLTFWTEEYAQDKTDTMGSQRCGLVWEMCNHVLEKRMPRGNCNSMRRNIMSLMSECQDSINEFQDVINAGVAPENDDEDVEDEDVFDGEDEMYSLSEMNVAKASLNLLKCSFRSLRVSLAVMDEYGAVPSFGAASSCYEIAHRIGNGVTDLASALYPPLDMQEVKTLAMDQANVISDLLDEVRKQESALSAETTDTIAQIRDALDRRRDDILTAVDAL